MADILVEVDIYQRSRDPEGVSYDVIVNWVDDTLPGGAVDPDGQMFLVEVDRKSTNEQVRDAIRDAVIIELERPVLSGGYGFSGLTRDNIRVEGYTNTGADFSPTAPVPWYSGDPFYPVFGGALNAVRLVARVNAELLLDPSLTENQKPDAITFTLSFSYGALPVLSTHLQYWVYAYNAANEAAGTIWTVAIPSTLVNTNQLEVTVDLTNVAQDNLWATEKILFQLAIKRLIGSGTTINGSRSGKLLRAQIGLTRL